MKLIQVNTIINLFNLRKFKAANSVAVVLYIIKCKGIILSAYIQSNKLPIMML